MPVRPTAAAGYVLAAVGVLGGITAFALTGVPTAGGCPRIFDPPADGDCVFAQLDRRRDVMLIAAASVSALIGAVVLLIREWRRSG